MNSTTPLQEPMTIQELEADYQEKCKQSELLLNKHLELKLEWEPKMEESAKLYCDSLVEKFSAANRLEAAKIRAEIQQEMAKEEIEKQTK